MMGLSRSLTCVLLVTVALLLSIGLVMVYSTTFALDGTKYFYRQAQWMGIGITGALVVTFVPREWLSRWSRVLLVLVVAALAYLFLAHMAVKAFSTGALHFFPLVPGGIKGGFRWLRLGQISIQPSEFAKFGLILYLSTYYGTRSRETIATWKGGVLIPGLASGAVLGFIFLGKDLSTTVIAAGVVMALMFLAGVRTRFLLLAVLLGVVAGTAAIALNPERVTRVVSYRHPELYKQDNGYQLWHSHLAMGSGGLHGRGFTRSIMKQVYLPEAHTDFILAVLGEELGYLGVLVVLGLYMLFLGCTVGVAYMCRDPVDMLICMGVGLLVAFQALVNISVVSGWCPTTGLTAPFLSYGGSSIISILLCVGLVFNICRRNLAAMHQEMLDTKVVPTYKVLHLARPE